MKKKATSLILCIAMILTMLPSAADVVWADAQPAESQTEAPVLAYVPLDNRPVNVDRVIYEAESAGFTVRMPNPDWYTTRLDGQPRNSNDTAYGNREKLLEWILEMDEETDYFVISLDQLLSGGLVHSRELSNRTIYDEVKMMDAILELSKNNHVYLVDTVVRLASCTVGYNDATLETYNYLRQYSLVPRHQLGGDVLTINNITTGYTRDETKKIVPVDKQYGKAVAESLRTRERKLQLIDYMLRMDTEGRIRYFIGIDDSSSQTTIQTNEVNYLKKKLGDRGLIYSGTDELGMMAVLNLMIDYYGYDIKAATVYFGDTETSGAGSIYDMETVQENVNNHLKSIGVRQVAPGEADVEVVVLTPPKEAVLNVKYINRMIDYINKNIDEGIPTIVIDSAPSAYNGNLEYRMVRECEMSMLMGYSSWNTVGNAVGLALCNGFSRYLYLQSRDTSSDRADRAFLKGLTFSYIKDISYQRGGGKTLFTKYLAEKGWPASNFYESDEQVQEVSRDLEKIFNEEDYNVSVPDILNNLAGNRYFRGLDGDCGIIGRIDVSNYSAPFFRTFELRFDMNVAISDVRIQGFKNAMEINMPYRPGEDQLTYAFDLYYVDGSGKVQKVPSNYDHDTGTIRFTTDKLSRFFTSALTIEKDKAYGLFTDVPNTAWYFNDVLYVHEKGLMKGTGENTFSPDGEMTRAMVLHMLYRLAGEPKTESSVHDELPADLDQEWYQKAVLWALEKEWISPDEEGHIQPDALATREFFADLLWHYAKTQQLELKSGKFKRISDYSDEYLVSPQCKEGLDWAVQAGIIQGTNEGSQLAPQSPTTRAEMATMMKRYLENFEIH